MKVGQNADKKGVLDELLQHGMVLVAIDARAEGVDVPEHLGVDPQLRLNLSWRFGRPMDIDAWGIFAELTFGGVPYPCKFPWDAIFLIVSHGNGESYLFPDHVPKELLHKAAESQEAEKEADAARKSGRGRPKLSLVAADGEGGHKEMEETQEPALEPIQIAAQTKKKKSSQKLSSVAEQPAAADVLGEGDAGDAARGPSSQAAAKDQQNSAGKTKDDEEGPPKKPARSRGHLRLVK